MQSLYIAVCNGKLAALISYTRRSGMMRCFGAVQTSGHCCWVAHTFEYSAQYIGISDTFKFGL
eukprot:4866235-Amphidinium_carterae.1